MFRAFLLLPVVLLATAAFSACGGDDDGGKSSSTTVAAPAGSTSKATASSSKAGKRLVEDPCGAVSLDDVRAVLPDAKAGEGGPLGADAASCIWRSAAKDSVSVEVTLITPTKDQVAGVKAGYAKQFPDAKVDVGDVGYFEGTGLVFFKGNVVVTLAAYDGVKKDSLVTPAKKLAAKI